MLTWLPHSRVLARCLLASCALAVLVLVDVQTAAACPMCKVALANGKGDLVSAYMWSILFLISMPFTILGLFSTYCYVQVRKARAAQAKPQAAGAAPINATADENHLVGSSAD